MWALLVIIGVLYVDAQHMNDGKAAASYNNVQPFPGSDDEKDKNVIETKYGKVRGFEEDGVVHFFDIPYGAFSDKPFQAPTEPAKWLEETRETREHLSKCPQMKENTYSGDKDCLTLSIFKAVKSNEPLPENTVDNTAAAVLFHIHDSDFSTGSGDPLLYGPKHLVENDIILVLPNYRLGALGFLCLLNETAPGNAALKDLTLALKWTADTIEAFGGDPSNIVVSGAGAGGALAEYLLISNTSRPYISRAITESGVSLSPWAIDRNPLATADSVPSHLLEDTVEFEELVKSTVDTDFRPCIERETGFMTESPWRLMKNQSDISYMVGTTNHAAWGRAIQLTKTENNLTELNRDLTLFLPDDLTFENNDEKLRVGRQVRSFYFGERDITATDVNQLSQLFTDSGYLNSALRGARSLVQGGANVYFYEYSFNNPDLKQAFDASTRGDSLRFVFSASEASLALNTDAEQTLMRNIMTRLWVSFIKTGTPSAEDIEWKAMQNSTPAEEEWLSIGSTVRMQAGLHASRMRIWREIYQGHFIDNNPGYVHKPSVYILLSGLSVLGRFGIFRG